MVNKNLGLRTRPEQNHIISPLSCTIHSLRLNGWTLNYFAVLTPSANFWLRLLGNWTDSPGAKSSSWFPDSTVAAVARCRARKYKVPRFRRFYFLYPSVVSECYECRVDHMVRMDGSLPVGQQLSFPDDHISHHHRHGRVGKSWGAWVTTIVIITYVIAILLL